MDKISKKEFLQLELDTENSANSLLQILKQRSPRCCMIYNIVKLHVDEKFSEKVKVKLYCREPLQDDSFIFTVLTFSYFSERIVLLSTPREEICNEFVEQIETTLDWNIPHSFGDLTIEQIPVVSEMCKRKSHPLKENKYFYYYIEIEKGKELELKLNQSVQVKPLNVKYAEKVDEKWGASAPGLALDMVQDSIESIGSIGVFQKCTDSPGVNEDLLMSWLIISPVGSFNALHTEKEFRRQGYGELALKYMIRYASENLEIFPVCHVELENAVSRKLMEKVGLQQGHYIYWLDYALRPSGS